MGDSHCTFRAVQSHDLPRAALENLPDDLIKLDDGTQFLQLKLPGLYVYYSRKTLQKAVENGLVALVADGIHKLPKKSLAKTANCIPFTEFVMVALRKNQYDKVFRMVKEELVNYDVNLEHLRIIIDFERAVLASIRTSSKLMSRTDRMLNLEEDLEHFEQGRILRWDLDFKII
ncbi:unnamed protein product [Cylicocyclus nassatus]|uniref:Uncharacterized protein n=1 Tax=Cylicocyclus nassatus TaxID=53992 RepID=A0AA36DRM2_CYLNA|nr:unnamed protein product [Cylicocyclus nassatus]